MKQQLISSDRKLKRLEKLKLGERVAGAWTIVVLLLSIGLFVVGTFSGVTAMVADALHNMADVCAMFSAWFALKISQRKPGQKFRYGYYKAENLITLFIAVIIVFEAIQLLLQGYSALLALPEITAPVPALIAASISVIVHYFMMNHLFRIGRAIDSQALIVNAQERRVCIFASSIVFLTILLVLYNIPYVEGVVTILISLLVLRVGGHAARDSIYVLMDISPSASIEKEIREIMNSTPDIHGFNDLKLRKSGPFIFGEVNIQLKEEHVKRAHEIAHLVERKIVNAVEQVDAFTIHIEPYEGKEKTVVFPISEDQGLNSEITERLGRANYFMLLTLDGVEGKIKNFIVETNPSKRKTTKAGLAAANAIIGKGADVLIAKEVGEISFHTLRDHHVDLYVANGKTVQEVVDKFIKNELIRMTDHK